MLRGMVSRLLLSDPSYRPLPRPLDPPRHRVTVAADAERLTVTVALDQLAQSQHINYLPWKSDKFDMRLYHRVEVPDGVRLAGNPEVSAGTTELTRHHVRHEVWGGKRYLNLQIEAPWRNFKPDTRATYIFPLEEK